MIQVLLDLIPELRTPEDPVVEDELPALYSTFVLLENKLFIINRGVVGMVF